MSLIKKKVCSAFSIFLVMLLLPAHCLCAQENSNTGNAAVVPDSEAVNASALSQPGDVMTDIMDIKPIEIYGIHSDIIVRALYITAGILLVLLALYAFRYFKNRHPGKNSDILSLPPEQIALSAVDALEAQTGIDDKAYYFRLSAIMRSYMHGRWHIDALEMTTEELWPVLRGLQLDGVFPATLKTFLTEIDGVKYAKSPSGIIKRSTDADFVREFVRETTPEPKI